MTQSFKTSPLSVAITVSELAFFAVLTGLVTAFAAIAFVESILFIHNHLLAPTIDHQLSFRNWHLMVIAIAIPTIGGLVVGVLSRSIRNNQPHAILESIKASHSIKPFLPLSDGLKSAVATIISMGCGASVGHYGPITHLGTTLGSALSQLVKQTKFNGTIAIGCGASAAIATAFNAPIAAIVFAHEVILRHYSLRSFAPISIAASTGYFISHVVFQRAALVKVDHISAIVAHEFLFFIVIGIIGAFVASALVNSVIRLGQFSHNLNIDSRLKPAIAGFALGVAALWLPEVYAMSDMLGKLTVEELAFTWSQLGIILIAKFVLTAACLAFGFAGGIFSPSLLIGALTGTLIGLLLFWLTDWPHGDLAVYAICGMMAVTSPIIGAPLTSILIVLELTGNYDLATASMISVVFANLIAYRLFGRSLFDLQLLKQNFDLSLGRDKVILNQNTIKPFIDTTITRYLKTSTLSDIFDGLVTANRTEAYIVDSSGQYIGTIRLLDLLPYQDDTTRVAADLAKAEPLILTEQTTIWSAMENMTDFVGESIPVTALDGHSQLFLGVVYEKDIIQAYLTTVGTIRSEEHAAG